MPVSSRKICLYVRCLGVTAKKIVGPPLSFLARQGERTAAKSSEKVSQYHMAFFLGKSQEKSYKHRLEDVRRESMAPLFCSISEWLASTLKRKEVRDMSGNCCMKGRRPIESLPPHKRNCNVSGEQGSRYPPKPSRR